ncbi:chaplin family protein [Streptomyces sp. NPDC051597]|uniref:chaplin family protein n=1 Tax=Streptomyces sp. NPDC051597 TaxID=3155049 RepID=UPI003423AFB3
MTSRRALAALTLTATASTVLAAAPASAGGVGDFLSPAFGTNCANRHTGSHATGTTTAGTGAATGNLLGLPLGSPANQCGGADLAPDKIVKRASYAKIPYDIAIIEG